MRYTFAMTENLINGTEKQIVDFSRVAMFKGNPKYEQAISRMTEIYKTDYDKRSPFERDEHRILHSTAYRRLKNKTQVFFATDNDHICTRIEHVCHVASIAETIAKVLNLNLELVNAIAIGHDLGHAPFGHQGEYILNDIVNEYGIQKRFWHEGNSLNFVDNLETLPDYQGHQQNLNLTYAVRDGIVCHCGEVNDKVLKPRDEFCDLSSIQFASHLSPFTYEGCVVKLSDTIAYLGRDIEDAEKLGLFNKKDIPKEISDVLGTTNREIVNSIITNVVQNSLDKDYICVDDKIFNAIVNLKKFNHENIYDKIYNNKELVEIKYKFEFLFDKLLMSLKEKDLNSKIYSKFYLPMNNDYKNNTSDERVVIDYIAGMTDEYFLN